MNTENELDEAQFAPFSDEEDGYIPRLTRVQEWLCDIFAIILIVVADLATLFITPLWSLLGIYMLGLGFCVGVGLGLLYAFVLRPRLFYIAIESEGSEVVEKEEILTQESEDTSALPGSSALASQPTEEYQVAPPIVTDWPS